MKTVTKLEIPPSFDTKVVELVHESVSKAGMNKNMMSMSDIYPLVTYIRAELKIAYSLGVEQGLIKGLVAFKKELDLDKKESNDEY